MNGLSPLYDCTKQPMNDITGRLIFMEPNSCKKTIIKYGSQQRTNKIITTIIIWVTFLAVFMASACCAFWLAPSPGTSRDQSVIQTAVYSAVVNNSGRKKFKETSVTLTAVQLFTALSKSQRQAPFVFFQASVNKDVYWTNKTPQPNKEDGFFQLSGDWR